MKKFNTLLLIVLGFFGMGLLVYIKFQKKILKDTNGRLLKFKKYYQLYNAWIQNKNLGFSFSDQLLKIHYNKIAIYGNGEIGCRLYEELKGTKVQVAFFIDKIANDIEMMHDENVPVIGYMDIQGNRDIDAIVITNINILDEIKELLASNTTCDIISIEELFENF